MNVLYAGLENPVTVSVPGVAQRDVNATFDGPGELVKNADGSYTVKPTTRGKYKIHVSAKVDGNNMSMGDMEFRVKTVPNPIAKLDGVYDGGKISINKMKSASGVVPVLDFDFAARFTVVSYTITYATVDGLQKFPCTGPTLDGKFKTAFNGRAKPGQSVFFDDIIVRGPEGNNRSIPSLAFVVMN
jgi:hypothetical protein